MSPVPVSRSSGARLGREGDAEVGDHRLAFVKQDVLRLDVAVDQPAGVGVVEGRGDLPHDGDRLVDRELLLPGEPLAQRFAADVGHDIEEEARPASPES